MESSSQAWLFSGWGRRGRISSLKQNRSVPASLHQKKLLSISGQGGKSTGGSSGTTRTRRNHTALDVFLFV